MGAGVTREKAARLELAVEEWVENVVRHGYAGESGTLSVSVNPEGERLLVEIADDGPAFDPTAADDPDVTLPLAERERGGLGLLLMRRMVGELSYRRVGRKNIVTFAISR